MRRELDAQAVQLEELLGQRGRALVQLRALDRDRCLVADRGEQLEVALVVRVRTEALHGDRADSAAMEAERRDHERPLDERSPRASWRQLEADAVLLRVAQEDRPIGLDTDARERARHGALFGRHLMIVLEEVAEREKPALTVGDADVEGVDIERVAHLRNTVTGSSDIPTAWPMSTSVASSRARRSAAKRARMSR